MTKEKKHWVGVLNFPLDLFMISVFSVIIFLVVELLSRIHDLYLTNPDVDVITHMTAGIAFFYTFYFLTTVFRDNYKKRLSFGFTFIGAIIWEIIETLGELIIVDPPHLKDIFFWDGFFDIIFTMVGAGIAILMLDKLRTYLKKHIMIKFFENK